MRDYKPNVARAIRKREEGVYRHDIDNHIKQKRAQNCTQGIALIAVGLMVIGGYALIADCIFGS